MDSTWANAAFADKLGVKFSILSDASREISKSYGVFNEAQLVANLVDDARSNVNLAIRLARSYREKGHEAMALCLLGQVALRDKLLDRSAAERTIRASLDLAESLGMQPVIAKSRRLLMAG